MYMHATHAFFVLTPTPLGDLLLVEFNKQLVRCDWNDSTLPSGTALQHLQRYLGNNLQTISALTPLLQETTRQIGAYFSGDLQTFSLPILLLGTDFQVRVWKALQDIPYGVQISYSEHARHAGVASAVRAVGSANHRNPLSIILPCHRVVGKNGKLVGYGGGLQRKAALLELEAQHL